MCQAESQESQSGSFCFKSVRHDLQRSVAHTHTPEYPSLTRLNRCSDAVAGKKVTGKRKKPASGSRGAPKQSAKRTASSSQDQQSIPRAAQKESVGVPRGLRGDSSAAISPPPPQAPAPAPSPSASASRDSSPSEPEGRHVTTFHPLAQFSPTPGEPQHQTFPKASPSEIYAHLSPHLLQQQRQALLYFQQAQQFSQPYQTDTTTSHSQLGSPASSLTSSPATGPAQQASHQFGPNMSAANHSAMMLNRHITQTLANGTPFHTSQILLSPASPFANPSLFLPSLAEGSRAPILEPSPRNLASSNVRLNKELDKRRRFLVAAAAADTHDSNNSSSSSSSRTGSSISGSITVQTPMLGMDSVESGRSDSPSSESGSTFLDSTPKGGRSLAGEAKEGEATPATAATSSAVPSSSKASAEEGDPGGIQDPSPRAGGSKRTSQPMGNPLPTFSVWPQLHHPHLHTLSGSVSPLLRSLRRSSLQQDPSQPQKSAGPGMGFPGQQGVTQIPSRQNSGGTSSTVTSSNQTTPEQVQESLSAAAGAGATAEVGSTPSLPQLVDYKGSIPSSLLSPSQFLKSPMGSPTSSSAFWQSVPPSSQPPATDFFRSPQLPFHRRQRILEVRASQSPALSGSPPDSFTQLSKPASPTGGGSSRLQQSKPLKDGQESGPAPDSETPEAS